MDQELIDRINELALKSKAEGLTDAEKKEQAELRAEFILEFRKNFRRSLENIEIEYPDGSVVNVKERHDAKYGKAENET